MEIIGVFNYHSSPGEKKGWQHLIFDVCIVQRVINKLRMNRFVLCNRFTKVDLESQ
jgi:hypothetical protein